MKIRTVKIRRKNTPSIAKLNNTTIAVHTRFVTKGSEWHMTIPTQIIIEENKNETFITCYGQMTKPFLLSLAFGLVCPFPALVSNQLLICLLLCLGLFAILFVFFMNRIVYTTKDYLKRLQI